MQQYKFWATITVNGVKQRREFVITAGTWTEARRILSAEIKQAVTA